MFKFILVIMLFWSNGCLGQVDSGALSINAYRDKIFALFSKCNSIDDEIAKAIKARNVNALETKRIELLQCANTSIRQLNTIENFNGDPALKYSCRDVLKFYIRYAESDLPGIRNFILLEDKFLITQNEFKKKPVKKYSQPEISSYNSEVKKYNEALKNYTQLNTFITGSKKQTLYNWNASQKIFMDAHKPKS